jgi:hypothetical protein
MLATGKTKDVEEEEEELFIITVKGKLSIQYSSTVTVT